MNVLDLMEPLVRQTTFSLMKMNDDTATMEATSTLVTTEPSTCLKFAISSMLYS